MRLVQIGDQHVNPAHVVRVLPHVTLIKGEWYPAVHLTTLDADGQPHVVLDHDHGPRTTRAEVADAVDALAGRINVALSAITTVDGFRPHQDAL